MSERKMEMQIKHFSHDHPLILKRVLIKNRETDIKCICCRKAISEEDQVYGCYECNEDYFLHKVCAQLPREIWHPKHKHYLVLFSRSPYSSGSFGCDECDESKDGFTYHCSRCKFDLDVPCALQSDYTIVDLEREKERQRESARERQKQRERQREIEREIERERHRERQMEMKMQMKHFSHEHPLILKDVLKAHETEIICKCCEQRISEEEQAYGCYQCDKDYFLHKACAELPREILHPKHTQHSLLLLSVSPYQKEIPRCRDCGYYNKGFTYHCSLCEFDLDIFCALEDNYRLVDPGIKHDAHEHPLILLTRPGLFRCDACGVEDKDQFYLCLSCPFYLHKSCASLTITGNREDHEHTLSLAYEMPSDYRKYNFNCDICSKRIFCQYWVYYCRLCRYFVHLKCMTSLTKEEIEANKEKDLLEDASFEEKLLKVLLDDDLLHLPSTDLSEKMIKRFLLRKNKLTHIQPEIKHWHHEEHPLILFSHEQQNEDEIEEILCNCCIERVSAPYYSCSECSYFLHLACANIPKTLQHSTHPHSLTLDGYPKLYTTFSCNNCHMISNGLFYKCSKTCDYFLDVKCAAFPSVIEHQHHRHPLLQSRDFSDVACNGCDFKIEGLAFGCESCKFYVHFRCAMLPRAIKHRWAKHPIPLRFPPHSDHPDEFICDMCEAEELNPKLWIYYSTESGISFHPRCVPQVGKYPNMKFGAMVEVSCHQHPLKFVEKGTLKSSCDVCEKLSREIQEEFPWFLTFEFECEDCNFVLCRGCVKAEDA